jgi:hypothetical protein
LHHHPMWYWISDRSTKWSEKRGTGLAKSDTMVVGVVEPLVGGKSPMDNNLDNSLRA